MITVSTLKEDNFIKLSQKSFEHNSGFSKICDFFKNLFCGKQCLFPLVTYT